MGRKRIHPEKKSLDERIGFSDSTWENLELDTGIKSQNFYRKAMLKAHVIHAWDENERVV